ncbi:Uma2 family endonuclease [bacterium]|nr:Uma2 family endonuclease [bacterium]MBT9584892.1 Uma2 family endonuclease [bacterium]
MTEPALEWDDEAILPDLTHVVTEDDEPVDNLFSERQQRLLVDSLYASGMDLQPFVAMANVGLFFNANQPPFVPDVLLSFGVQPPDGDIWEKKNRSYFIWMYGKPPELVVEVVSNKERHEEEKIQGYARLGIAYYVIYDPGQFLNQRKLRVYELHGASYVPVVDSHKLTSVPLGIKLVPGEFEGLHGNWLRWVDAQGNLLLTGSERAEAERVRADGERVRAECERERAERERERAERLVARLRELGIDPEEDAKSL